MAIDAKRSAARTTKKESILIRTEFLSANEHERYQALHLYFPDSQILSCRLEGDCWRVDIERCNYDYCEDLGVGLEWLGISCDDIPWYYRLGSNYIFALLDAWIPFGISLYLSRKPRGKQSYAIIHVDSHGDMMRTRVASELRQWKDLLTGLPVSFEVPNSVRSAVQSGAIGIGSMLTPIVHYLHPLRIFHLSPGASGDITSTIKPCLTVDTLVDRNSTVLDVAEADCSSHNYYLSNCPKRLLRQCDDADVIFLHIDMDYFNNRYNGDSGWRTLQDNWDPGQDVQYGMIDNLVSAITCFHMQKRIEHVSIGVSPSFFPVEYWQPCIFYLIQRLSFAGVELEELLGILGDGQIG